MEAQRLHLATLGYHGLKEEQLKLAVMASLFFPQDMSLPSLLSLLFAKLSPAWEFTTYIYYMAKITLYCLSIMFQTQAERLYIDSRVNDIHIMNKLILTTFQVRYKH